MAKTTVLILMLCATILVNEATSYILPSQSKTIENQLTAGVEKNSTKNEMSDDYRKYSYIITTYL